MSKPCVGVVTHITMMICTWEVSQEHLQDMDRSLLDYWSDKDPISTHRQLLLDLGISNDTLESIEEEEKKKSLVENDRRNCWKWIGQESRNSDQRV